MSASGRRAIVAAVPVVALLLVARWWSGAWRLQFQDLQVYRDGAQALWHGRSIYRVTSTAGLPFTYPPFAALAFTPLSFGALPIVAVCFTTASAASLWMSVRMSGTALGLSRDILAIAFVLAFAVEPVGRTLGLGQVNLMLDAAILADACAVPAHRRGYLTGLAAGIKVVPLVFAAHYALQRDWGALRRVIAACAATVALAGVIAPRDTATYWTRLLFDPSRVGAVEYTDNQSLLGAAARVLHTPSPARPITVSLSLAALLMALFAARGQLRRGSELAALCCVATGGLLAAPVSWSHHWVWIVPMILVLVHQRRRIAATVFAAAAYLSPHWYPPSGRNRELHYSWWQTALTLDFVAIGLAFLVIMTIDGSRAVGSSSSASLRYASRPLTAN